jgi:hypothetical protein
MKKNYEIDNCNECNAEYKKYGNSKTGVCTKCRNIEYAKKYRELRQAKSEEEMMIYPLGLNEQKRRYTRLRNELNECQTREQLKGFFAKVINEMQENGLWKYCMSKTDKVEGKKNIDENGKPKVGRIATKVIEYPDTRNMHE